MNNVLLKLPDICTCCTKINVNIPVKKMLSWVHPSAAFCAVLWMETAECPCGECAHLIKDEDNAFFCEGACQAWFHARCIPI